MTKILVIDSLVPGKESRNVGLEAIHGASYRQLPALSQLTPRNDRPTNLGPDEARTIRVQQSAICIYEGKEACSGPQTCPPGARPTDICLPSIPDESDRVLINQIIKGICIIQDPYRVSIVLINVVSKEQCIPPTTALQWKENGPSRHTKGSLGTSCSDIIPKGFSSGRTLRVPKTAGISKTTRGVMGQLDAIRQRRKDPDAETERAEAM
jgi:hypothetical protein